MLLLVLVCLNYIANVLLHFFPRLYRVSTAYYFPFLLFGQGRKFIHSLWIHSKCHSESDRHFKVIHILPPSDVLQISGRNVVFDVVACEVVVDCGICR